jgi:hypothetical protein
MIRAGTGSQIESSFYFSWKMPGWEIGGEWYRDNISSCNATVISVPYFMIQEPGNKVGETVQGIDLLLAQDPSATWDDLNDVVVSSQNPSPRVFPIPLYDPDYYQDNMTHGRNADFKMVNWVGFFLEGRNGNDVYGRIAPITGVIDPNAGPAPAGTFPMAIRLVQ